MYKITFPRVGFDGKTYSQQDIEVFFLKSFSQKIKEKLEKLKEDENQDIKNKSELEYLDYLLKDDKLEKILLASPEKMEDEIQHVEKELQLQLTQEGKNKKETRTPFNEKLYEAFNYDGFRQSTLIQLVKKMNLKACPYCNHQYTLYVFKKIGSNHKSMAKFQYDHFFSKVKYPFLSMSLYNLIPSCSICNQGKTDNKLDKRFNPYVTDLGSIFKFTVAKPVSLFIGAQAKDEIELSLTPKEGYTPKEVNEYDETFNIKAQYARHKDIIQEIYDKTYLDSYFSEKGHFPFLSKIDDPRKLLYGVSLETSDIEKRPMTKFIQDLREQLKELNVDGKQPKL